MNGTSMRKEFDLSFIGLQALLFVCVMGLAAQVRGQEATASPTAQDATQLIIPTPETTLTIPVSLLGTTSGSDLFKRGLAAYTSQDYKTALDLLPQALASVDLGTKTPEVAQANADLGDIYQNHQGSESRLNLARTYYMAALEADPQNETAKKGLESLGTEQTTPSTTPQVETPLKETPNKLPAPSATSEAGTGREAKIEGAGDYFRVGASLPGLWNNFDGNELGQTNGTAVGLGQAQPYFFLPKVTGGYGFNGAIGRSFGGNISLEIGGFISLFTSEITKDQTVDQRSYLSGNVNPNLTAIGFDIRFLYELPLESPLKISPFAGLTYQSISMTNVMIDKTVPSAGTTVAYDIPAPDYTFGSYGLETGLYLGYDLNDDFQIFLSGQFPVVSLFSNNPSYPPQVISPSGSSALNTSYQSFSIGIKVTLDKSPEVEK